MRKIILLLISLFALMSCGQKTPHTTAVSRPAFSADTAYLFIQHQMNLGARVPGTKPHSACMFFLVNMLHNYGAEVEIQQGEMINYAGEQQPILNVIGRFGNAKQGNRILLAAHYDCRPWCDEEPNYDDRFCPLPGANDGASGVGILLEVARQLARMDSTLRTGVDIVFFDCEDMGTPSFYTGEQRENTWCLGSQLFSTRLVESGHSRDYHYGILLDMVGAPDAVFPKEYFSMQYASDYVEHVWHKAELLGHGSLFVSERSYPITDDHYYVNTIAGIPMLDIVHYDAHNDTGFPYWWHTREDDMRHIDPHTLQAVGEVVMAMIQ